jgi:hypothetical protein
MRTAAKGPWGTLEMERVSLGNSAEEFFDAPKRVVPPRWVFATPSAAQLSRTLLACGFTEAEKQYLLDTNHWEPISNGYAISPPDSLVLGLNPIARQQLYPLLARNPENYPQCWAFRFPAREFEEWFEDSGLTTERINYLKGMTYTNAGYLCLCVERPLLTSLNTNEARSLIRGLQGIPTWLVRLRLDRDSDIEGLLKYWGKGGREHLLRPLLDSLARRPQGGTVNISHLLPPFARLRLYIFPDPEMDLEVLKEDCFYTSLNFFKDPPDASYLDSQKTRAALKQEYTVVPLPAQFGDIITIVNSEGAGIHACVYIADDLVFTKNGSNYLQPWTLMRMPDMMAGFPSEKPQRIVLFRHKTS